jgi:hypothetical protein
MSRTDWRARLAPSSRTEVAVSDRLFHGAVAATCADVVDAGMDLLAHYELAALAVLDGHERPGELPQVRRRLRAEGIRAGEHRGVILLAPGELDQLSSIGLLGGAEEIFLCSEWNDEFESFPGRISGDGLNFEESTPLGLEEWMVDAHCLLAIGDGRWLNFATLDRELAARMRKRFKPAPR